MRLEKQKNMDENRAEELKQERQHWLKWFGVLAEQVQTSDFRHLTPNGHGDVLGSASTQLQLRSPEPA